jgi:hypothetical protein
MKELYFNHFKKPKNMTPHILERNIITLIKKKQKKVTTIHPYYKTATIIEEKDFKTIAGEIITMLKQNRMINDKDIF